MVSGSLSVALLTACRNVVGIPEGRLDFFEVWSKFGFPFVGQYFMK